MVDGVDRLPEILEAGADELAKDVGTPAEIVRLTRSIPSYYLKYYYRFDEVLAGQRDGAETRAGRGHGHRARAARRCTATRTSTRSRSSSSGAAARSTPRRPRSSSRRSTTDGATSRSSTSGTGGGSGESAGLALPELPATAVVEVPARITREGAQPLPQAPLDPGMRGLVQAVKAYEELAIAAARTGDRGVALAGAHGESSRCPLFHRTAIAGCIARGQPRPAPEVLPADLGRPRSVRPGTDNHVPAMPRPERLPRLIVAPTQPASTRRPRASRLARSSHPRHGTGRGTTVRCMEDSAVCDDCSSASGRPSR